MKKTIDSSVELVEPHLHSLLMSPGSLSSVKRAAQLLPRFAVNFFGFECRLEEGPGATDCALDLTADGARFLAGRHTLSPPAELQTDAWRRIQRFYQEWGDTREPAYVDAGATWLEFDTGSAQLNPNLLFGYWPHETSIRRPKEWLLDVILPLLLGTPISEAFRSNLLQCFDACPPGTDDFQIGAMIARRIQAVRLCVFDIRPDDLPAFLTRVGWKGDLDEVRRYLDAFAPHADFVGVHLDVGEKLFPQIGIEPGFTSGPWARQPHLEPRWHRQFDKLVELGLCIPAKRDALMSWIGHQRYPLAEQGEEVVLLRGLSHIKINLRSGASPVAKAYFGIAHRSLRAGADTAA
ncbi:hypothetical protein F0U62_37315 [Cystobacter fuscus]|nr:hypothetical protein F0U62_37315 [Cystobacter fuscus]